ncbi:MAG: 50S ribosomal protein L11 methyltransferase, partial [Sediminibacterium sp.]
IGFDGFNEEEAATGINNGVGMSSILGTAAGLGAGSGNCKAYILSADFKEQKLENELEIIFNQYNLTYSKSIVKEKNWNAIWESNFEPVRVDDFVGIRAYFHPSFDPPVLHEIHITPKMSFGTGHHATTFTVMQLMGEVNFTNKSVYDFGSGTGILAILAEKLGASSVLAVDNDDWCIENSIENIQNNDCKIIKIQKVVSAIQNQTFDIVLANVNRHIIEANMLALTQAGKKGGQLILSGLLIEDQEDMINLAMEHGWNFIKSKPLNGWVSLLFNL